nr:hypothetical protein [Tanacetum cinerariifolium]
MNPLIAQQVDLDEALVALENRSMIDKCNMRIKPIKTRKEATYQVVLDTLKESPCYKAFLVTADVPEIYIHQFWFTISKIKDSSSYKFQLDKTKFKVRVEVFREVLQIYPRLPNQVKPHSHEEIITFIKELGYIRELESIPEMYIDHLSQLWRNFASIINKCLSGKTTGIDNKQTTTVRRSSMPYPSKNDSVLGMLKFVSKYEENQVYGKSIPDVMLSKEVMETKVYKTYLAFATGNVIPKKAKKRTTSHIKESSLIADDNIIPDDPDEVPDESKGKTKNTNKGVGSKPKVLDVSKAKSSDQESKNKSWGDSEEDDDDPKSDDERTKSYDVTSIDLNKTVSEEEPQGDEFVHTPDDYVPTDDET